MVIVILTNQKFMMLKVIYKYDALNKLNGMDKNTAKKLYINN